LKTADLHIHTTASDGAFSVSEVLEEARKLGLSAIAITDHDSVEALPRASALAPRYGIELIPGIEISVELEDSEVHLLGYCIDYEDPAFQKRLSDFRKARKERVEKMVKKLNELGLPLDMDELLPGQMTGAVGRLHVALALYRAGHVKTVPEAFRKYIGLKGPAYLPKSKISPKEAMDMILRLGGVPVLAHPGSLNRDEIIPELVSLGLAGLEVYYPSHNQRQVNHYLELARFHDLLVTGGSDCHGPNKGKILMGSVRIPYDLVERLKEKAGHC